MGAYRDFVATIREQLEQKNISVRSAAIQAGLPVRSVQGILEGHIPSVERAAEVASALNLEFYIGPKRDSLLDEEASPDWVRAIRHEMAVQRDEILSRLPEPSVRVAEDPAPYDSAGPIRLQSDGEGIPAAAKAEDLFPAPYARDVRAAAGTGEIVFEEAAEFRFAFPRSILPTWIRPESLLCIRTKGDSMEPTLNDGDLILLDYSRTNPLDGQIFVLRNDDGLVVKRLRGSGFDWELISDNPVCPPRRVDQNDRVIGQVVWSGPLVDRVSD